MIVTLTLPWPPSVNEYWRHPGRGPLAGRHLISAEGRTYRRTVRSLLPALQPLGERLHVAIHAYPPDRRRRDLDNLPKAVLDALTHAGLWGDDSQIDHLEIERHETRPGGEIEVVIALRRPDGASLGGHERGGLAC